MTGHRRRSLTTLLLTSLLAIIALPALAHPLGNLSANSSAHLVVQDTLTITYVLDLAEVPAFQARQSMGLDDGVVAAEDAALWRDRRCAEIRDGLQVRFDDRDATLLTAGADLTFPDGEAGLVTLRLVCELTSDDAVSGRLTYQDTSDLGTAGWREVTASVPAGASANVPDTSPTDQLRSYPEGVAPLRVTSATIDLTGADTGAADAADDDGLDPVTRAIESMTSSLTELVAREDFTFPFAVLAIVLSLVFGAIHALAPGHGKTVMAAYLVSQRGTTRQAIGLGLTTAVTHTFGVLTLGIILSVTQAFAPAELYPYLGLSSGLLFVVVGVLLLTRSLRNRGHEHGTGPGQHTHAHLEALVLAPAGATAHDHSAHDHGTRDHAAAHAHQHEHEHQHEHGQDREAATVAEARPLTTWRAMILPGIAGGLVPSPSALVVLVGGIALGRTWFSIVLVTAYGLGMAATLVAAGFALTRARGWIEQRAQQSGRLGAVTRVLPAVTAGVVVLGGVALTLRSLAGIL